MEEYRKYLDDAVTMLKSIIFTKYVSYDTFIVKFDENEHYIVKFNINGFKVKYDLPFYEDLIKDTKWFVKVLLNQYVLNCLEKF